MFEAGDAVVLRSVFTDHVGAVVPAVVVADTAEFAAIYQPPGSTQLLRTGRRGGPRGRNMFPGGWDGGYADTPWRGRGVVRVHGWGQPWSVWRWLDGDDWRPGFYVNLEAPWQRTPVGFDSADWILDLVVAEGCHQWTWKDEDELAWSLEVGAVTSEYAARVRQAGAAALASVQARTFPFDADWDLFRPPAGIAAPHWPPLRSFTGLTP